MGSRWSAGAVLMLLAMGCSARRGGYAQAVDSATAACQRNPAYCARVGGEEAVVPLEEKRLPPEPFPGKPFVFDFEIPVRPDPVAQVGQKEAAKGVTPTLDRVSDSPVGVGLVCEPHRRAGRIQGCLPS